MTLCESVICRFDQNNKSEASASFFCALLQDLPRWQIMSARNPVFTDLQFLRAVKIQRAGGPSWPSSSFFRSVFSVRFFFLYHFWSIIWSALTLIFPDLCAVHPENQPYSLPISCLKFFFLHTSSLTRKRKQFYRKRTVFNSQKYFCFWTFLMDSVQKTNLWQINPIKINSNPLKTWSKDFKSHSPIIWTTDPESGG